VGGIQEGKKEGSGKPISPLNNFYAKVIGEGGKKERGEKKGKRHVVPRW